ncbi:MAG: hypothetical protein R2711_08385 [Acidimicrobiales bacterium]
MGGIQLDLDLSTWPGCSRSLSARSSGDAAVPALGTAIPDQLAAGSSGLCASAPGSSGSRAPAVLGDGSRVTGRAVVVATEGPRAAELVGVRDPGSKRVAALWFTAPEPPVRGRSIVLDGEGAVRWPTSPSTSEVAPSYAPPGRPLFVAACPGESGDGLETAARLQMSRWFGDVVDRWEVLRCDDQHGQPSPRCPSPRSGGSGAGDGGTWRATTVTRRRSRGDVLPGRRAAEAVLADLAAS